MASKFRLKKMTEDWSVLDGWLQYVLCKFPECGNLMEALVVPE